jgi:4-amino-4-deoxy-L-arabinose transferase-like glycosyltransferase
MWSDPSRRFLLLWFGFGLVFFSAFLNKLPGYLLPLLPPVCALIGIALGEARSARVALTIAVCLLAVVPAFSGVLPQAVRSGISRAELSNIEWLPALPFLAAMIPVWIWERRGRRDRAMACVSVLAVAAVVYLQLVVLPLMDHAVSTRQLAADCSPPGSGLRREYPPGMALRSRCYSVTPLLVRKAEYPIASGSFREPLD